MIGSIPKDSVGNEQASEVKEMWQSKYPIKWQWWNYGISTQQTSRETQYIQKKLRKYSWHC